MKNTKDINAITAKIIETLKAEPDGYKTTTWRILKTAGYDPDSFSREELMDIHFSLFEEAEKHDLYLDMSSHYGKVEGLPYDLDFVLHRVYRMCGGIKVPDCVVNDEGETETNQTLQVGWCSEDYTYENFIRCGMCAVLKYRGKVYFVNCITNGHGIDVYEVPDEDHYAGYRDKLVAHYDTSKEFYEGTLFGIPMKEVFDHSIIWLD